MSGPEFTRLMLPRVGAAVAGTALVFPWLTVPLVLGCLAMLGYAAIEETRADNEVPEVSPGRDTRGRMRQNGEDTMTASEDSFPASDPPSWTPVTGTGTRH